jgi:hypothetical protein
MKTSKRLPEPIPTSRYAWILIASFVLSVISALSHAQNEGRWYNVEILVFKRLDQHSQSQEFWRDDLALDYPHFYEYIGAPNVEAKSQLSALTKDLYVLQRYRDALARSENFKILTHMAWSQQMANEAESPAIIISGGDEIGNHQELEGYLKIHIARFLHVTSNLWLTNTSAESVNSTIEWPALPPMPSLAQAGRSKPLNLQAGKLAQTEVYSGVLKEINRGFNRGFDANYNSPYPIITLQNKRRMRSNELHYVDHPAMGILIFMTPIEDT